MALVNHAKKEINAKIVYYGPPHSGKGTILNYIYTRIKPSLRGELRATPAGSDNLLFFDFSPFEAPLPNGYHFRLHIYTLTGLVTNPATWKMILKGSDGIIIVADPAPERIPEARDSVLRLRDFLAAYGKGLHETPAILQLNSVHTGTLATTGSDHLVELDLPSLPVSHTSAASGEGVVAALTTLSRTIIEKATTAEPGPVAPHNAVVPSPEQMMVADDLPHHLFSPVPPSTAREELPPLVVQSQDIVCSGREIRIPLEIGRGSDLRRVVVSVTVELDQQ